MDSSAPISAQAARLRPSAPDQSALIAALRAGDERVFESLVSTHHGALVRLASQYVDGSAVAEEVAQEAWIAFLQSLERFEGRSSLKTWLFRILLNCARARRRSEVRSVPLSALFDADAPEPPSVDDARFMTSGTWAGGWAAPPKARADGEGHMLGDELRAHLQLAIDALPPAHREVLVLRDVEGLSKEEVCELLGVSEANQRVLLHRARSRVRAALEPYFEAKGASA